jgi:hypothetical protein
MGVLRLDRIVAKIYSNWRAKRIDTKARLAYSGWYNNHNLKTEKEEVLSLDSSDITNIVTPDFRGTWHNKGCYWCSNDIPWYVRTREKKAFRAELRKGERKAKGKYLAMLWESTGNPNRCKVYYRTDYMGFSLNDRELHKPQ